MKISINLDMDGTIANLYAVDGWLDMLRAYDPTPYMDAEPLIRLSQLAYHLNRLQRNGFEINIISWLSKCSTPEYDEDVTDTKLDWLAQHLPSVTFDNIIIVPYGTPKENYCTSPEAILFDDEEHNRNNWTGKAYPETDIFNILKSL